MTGGHYSKSLIFKSSLEDWSLLFLNNYNTIKGSLNTPPPIPTQLPLYFSNEEVDLVHTNIMYSNP